jgi:internalin A
VHLSGIPDESRDRLSDNNSRLILRRKLPGAVPEWISNVTTLIWLDLSENELLTLPYSVGKLTGLTRLDLGSNRLTSLPESLGMLTSLTRLDLGSNQLAFVPDVVEKLTRLTWLDLSGNGLTVLPEWLGRLTALEWLDLGGNRLTALPGWLGKLPSLTWLNLSGNRLASVPESLGESTVLTWLNLGGNELASEPKSLGRITSLTQLNLSGNRLISLPRTLGNLTALEYLYLSSNRLESLPETLGNLLALKRLDLRNNQLRLMPEWTGKLADLTQLDLAANRLVRMPESLGKLSKLTRLDLRGNQLESMPRTLGDLAALTELDLRGNQLARVPDSIGKLTALTELDLSDHELARVPDSLGNLTGLIRLDLHGNQLDSVPDSLGNLTALAELDLHGNQLDSVPDSLGNLTGLASLDLRDNQLAQVPDSLANLTSLIGLDLRGNRLVQVPEPLRNLVRLTSLRLDRNQLIGLPVWLADFLARGVELGLEGNPLADPLPELAKRGSRELATYLRSLSDAEPQYEAKLLMVGEGNVGKTSLIAALRQAPFVEGRPTTHGIEITPLTFRDPSADKDMTLRGWDFGGQEVYRITHQFFFTPRALYVVVWNARQGQEQDEVEGWLRRIRLRIGRDARAVLVATHCDERRPELDYPHLQRAFPGMLAGTFETDSSIGLGIEKLRYAIGEEAARLPQMGQLWSPRWVAAREEILARGKTEPQIWYAQFAEICGKHGLSGPETSTLAKLMHDLGLIVYYSDDEGLRDIVVLNPEWLTKAISHILEDEPTRQAGGILDHGRLRQIWEDRGGYERRYHPYFLRLMEKFDISYRIEGEDARSLVAQLVPLQAPPLPWQLPSPPPAGIRTLTFLCRMSEPAPGLIPWLTVRHHRDSTGTYWRHGIFLRHRIAAYASEALLELRGGTELAVQVRAPSPDLYFNVLRDSIEDLISRRWLGLSYRLYIPCPGTAGDGSLCTGLFPLDGLLRQREGGQTIVACMDCRATPAISTLLTGFAGPSVSLAAELEQVNGRLAEITAGITSVQGQAAQIADTVRRVHHIVGTEVTDCPRLFSLGPSASAGIKRALAHQDHYRLTLWCEHPGYEHPWESATYNLDLPKEWLARIAPYAVLVFKTLQLIVPLAGAVAIAALPTAQQSTAQTHLEIMKAIVTALPTTRPTRTQASSAESTGQLTAAEGAALRAIRQIIFEHDHLRAFGGLRRVQTPAGDLVWVCENHYPDYDPGLPIVQ